MPDPPMTGDYTNYYLNESNRQLANDLATKEYNQSKAAGESETRALERAKFAWEQAKDRANLTGRFEDSWTMPTQQWWATNFGTWMPNGPQAGQETMAREQQTFGQGATLGQMYGQYYAPGTAPTQGQQTLAGSEQAYTQALRAQQEARAAQAQQQSQAQAYLTLLSNLRGPADWAKYQQVLGATPGGMRDLAAAAMGQYIPGGGATTGMQPQAVSLQSLMGDVSGQPYTGQGGGQLNMPNVYQGGQGSYGSQQAAAAFNPQMQANLFAQGGRTGMPSQTSGYVPGSNNAMTGASTLGQPAQQYGGQQEAAIGGSSGVQMYPNAAGGGTNMYGAPQNNTQLNLPAPNQVAPQAWKNLAPSQQELMKGQWESQGWYKPDVEALMNQALPKYAANAPAAGTWRLR